MTAYAQYRLAVATIARKRDLFAQKLITPKQFEKVNADYEVALANYQSLMDQMGFEVRLANTRAQQARKQAETAVRATQERLRILGVKPDGTEPEVEHGKVVGVQPDGTLPGPGRSGNAASEKPETILPSEKPKSNLAVAPVGTLPCDEPKPHDGPVSTYSIWAPFDGTILDREMIVPGCRRRHDPPHLHHGQPLDRLGRGERPRGRLRHARPKPRAGDPLPVAGLSRARLPGRGDLRGRPR